MRALKPHYRKDVYAGGLVKEKFQVTSSVECPEKNIAYFHMVSKQAALKDLA